MPIVYTHVYIQSTKHRFFTSQPNGVLRPPNTIIVFHDYPTAPLIFEVRGLPARADSKSMDKYRGVDIGLAVDCEGGSMVISDYAGARILDKDGKEIKRFKASSSHFANCIDAVRSRKPSDLHADILEGHLSSALCHTGNISYRLGKTQTPEEIREAVQANKNWPRRPAAWSSTWPPTTSI